MLPMSSPDVNPGAVETQQMRVVAPVGLSSCTVALREIDTYHLSEQYSSSLTDIVLSSWPGSRGPSRLRRISTRFDSWLIVFDACTFSWIAHGAWI
ncbi:hypothetical protein PILCRDRAFT_742311 [Piloderma croceum F 1598]|uniref:Uncharacterized protein n=1 Tax=Piloderma croceum (strain F 1598) TaxID=765440 RepID=A0A0C3B4Y6_PILCF|nr:hypothetical protein PILCRDRAFT_742311 [Piloderma croceum F 1598]